MDNVQEHATHAFVQGSVEIAKFWLEEAYGRLPDFDLLVGVRFLKDEPLPSASPPSMVSLDPQKQKAVFRYNPEVIGRWRERGLYSRMLYHTFAQLAHIYQLEPHRLATGKTWEQVADYEASGVSRPTDYRLWLWGGGMLASLATLLRVMQTPQLVQKLLDQVTSWTGSAQIANDVVYHRYGLTYHLKDELLSIVVAGSLLTNRRLTPDGLGLTVGASILSDQEISKNPTFNPDVNSELLVFWDGAYLCSQVVKGGANSMANLLTTPHTDDQLKAVI